MELWPLFGLTVATPRLELRYVTDELGVALAELAAEGVHDPAVMPFSTPWTDVAPPELQRNSLRHFWRNRAEVTAAHWSLNFAVCVDSAVVGTMILDADDFPLKRSAETGSWVGLRYQGRGIGTETRRAALYLLFAGFDGRIATTLAWHDNLASLGVTRKLGYRVTGSSKQLRRDKVDTLLHFEMTRAQWERRGDDDIRVTGIEPVREMLGLA